MSVLDDILRYPLVPFTVGDGNTYEVYWMGPKSGSIDPKTAKYEYAGKIGTKLKRNSTSSPIYDLDFWVPAEQFTYFRDSISSFENECTFVHPLYGDLKGEPTSISFDDSGLAYIRFNVQYQTNLTDDLPTVKPDFASDTIKKGIAIQDEAIEEFGELEVAPVEVDVLSDFVDNMAELYDNILNNDYINKLYDIRQTISDSVFNAKKFMSLTNDLINTATRILPLDGLGISDTVDSITDNVTKATVKSRTAIIDSQNTIILAIDETDTPDSADGNKSTNLASFKELIGACNQTALAATLVTPSEAVTESVGFDITDETVSATDDELLSGNNAEITVDSGTVTSDYKYKKDVDAIIEAARTAYNLYVQSVSEIDLTGEGFTKYVPNDTISNNLSQLFGLAIQGIKDSTLTAQEENTYITEHDTIPEILAFKLYGSATAQNTNAIINDNDLFGKESLTGSWRNLVIRKNTEIKYYV